MIEDFIKEFTDQQIPHIHKRGKEFYLMSDELASFTDKIQEHPVTSGLYLGKVDRKQFKASPALLELIAPLTDKKMILNEKSAWLFICGRDILKVGIVSKSNHKGLLIVTNEQGEVLGLAKKDKDTYKNMLDIGVYLRREK